MPGLTPTPQAFRVRHVPALSYFFPDILENEKNGSFVLGQNMSKTVGPRPNLSGQGASRPA